MATMTDTLYRRPAVVKEKKSYIETDAYKVSSQRGTVHSAVMCIFKTIKLDLVKTKLVDNCSANIRE